MEGQATKRRRRRRWRRQTEILNGRENEEVFLLPFGLLLMHFVELVERKREKELLLRAAACAKRRRPKANYVIPSCTQNSAGHHNRPS